MHTQQPERDTEKQRARQQTRRKWRRIALLLITLTIVGLLSPLIFPRMVRDEAPRPDGRHPLFLTHQQEEMVLPAQPTPSTPSGQVAAQIDSLLMQQVKNQQFSGSVLVAQNGQVLLAKGYSKANWDTSAPNTPDTRFYLGSITKAFTAMSILMLQQQGKLQVQKPICTYIPNCPPPWQPVSVHEVLTHTSGIPQLDDTQLSSVSPAAWISSFDNASLQFTPGGAFQYCSVCYQILAYVVQQVSGMPYTRFVQQMILTPLGMTNSGFDSNTYYSRPGSATGYEGWQIKAPLAGYQVDPRWSFLFGSGLLYSTVNDLYRWDQALDNNTLVPQATLNQAFTPYVNATLFPGSQYGYGWFITQSPVSGHQLFWHDGVLDGFRNYIGRYVDDNVTIIFLSNLSTLDIESLAHSLEKIVFGSASSV